MPSDITTIRSLRYGELPKNPLYKVVDFKGISKLNLSIDSSLTLIAGPNGVGKTSVLEAIIASSSAVWSMYFSTSSDVGLTYPLANIVRVGSDVAKSELCLTSPDGSLTSVTLLSQNDDLRCGTHELRKLYPKRWSIASIPIIYNGQDRTVVSESKKAYGSRDNSLDAGLHSVPEFKKWFFEKEGDEGREVKERQDLKYSDPDLNVIRQVLIGMEGFHSIKSRLKEGSAERILYVDKHNLTLPFDSLSGGEKAFFVLAIDLARRLILRYPKNKLEECRALVCIDEIELHLHPTWQRRILGELTGLFPLCQFVVSTHSPQVIGGVSAKNVRLLSQDESGVVDVVVPSATRGRDSNYILQALLDATERDIEANQLFLRFDECLDAGNFDEAEGVLNQLGDSIEGSSSRVSARRIKLNRRRSKQQ